LALHFTWINDEASVLAFLPTLESALAPFSARPHWGKLTTLSPSTIRERTPMWTEFASLRQALDPSGTFLNPYVSRLL
jgi:xylitol oxidase